MTEHLRRIMRVARQAGMRVTIGDALNGGFTSTPREMRCAPVPDPLGRHGNFGVNLCPSKPAAREQLLRNWDRLLDDFADPGLGLHHLLALRRRRLRLPGLLAVGRARLSQPVSRRVDVGAQEMPPHQGHCLHVDLRHAARRRMGSAAQGPG